MKPSSRVAFGTGFVSRWTGIRIWSPGPAGCFSVLLVLLCLVPQLFAEASAPSPVSGLVPFHLVRGFAVIMPVTVNGQGPYDFMLDTGTTIMVVDRELGRELALEPQGQGTVTTLTQQLSASIAVVRRVDFGPVTEQNIEVMVRDLDGLRHIAPSVRGVLGQNALNHADFLLDYQHKQLQFDTDGELVRSLEGHHIPLRRKPAADNPRYGNLVVHGSVAGSAVSPMDFLLDSGAASPVIFDSFERELAGYPESFVVDTAGRQSLAGVRTLQFVIDGKSREMPTQVMVFKGVDRDIGGLLPIRMFTRIYISNNGGFAIFEPKVKKHGPSGRMIADLPPQPPGHGRKS
jgi:predicted aspartyl protease